MATSGRPMTTRRRTTSTIATTLVPRHGSSFLLLSCLILLPFASAACGVEFLYPEPGLTFYYLDTINVTYTSDYSSPTLFAWCGQQTSPAQKFKTAAPEHKGSVLVLLDFSSADPCWFDLQSDTEACGDHSPQFVLLPLRRVQSDSEATLALASSTAAASILPRKATESRTDSPPGTSEGKLGTGAKVGTVIALVGASLVVVGMAACFFFRRRKRLQEAVVAGHIVAHDRRDKNGQEKTPLPGSLVRSNGSKEPLRAQPVYDGFAGSLGGNDDLQSRGSSAHLHSPQSPDSPAGGFPPPSRNKSPQTHYMTDREALEAARLHSAPASSGVVSYGPNPVTPSITPRPSTQFHDNPGWGSGEEPHNPSSSMHSISPQPQAQYTVKHVPPPVVSYGPNRITPTPVIASVAPDDSVMTEPPDLPSFPPMGFPSNPFPPHDPQSPLDSIQDTPHDLIRHDLTDEPISHVAPLPPYASTADFYAMEKGAIRKLQKPAAQAELPPTKDGYYHFGDHGTEYELQGAAPEREQQHPHQPYRNQTAGVGRAREVDEQKFLLDEDEMRYLKEQKKRFRAEQQAARQGQTESYEMQPTWGSEPA